MKKKIPKIVEFFRSTAIYEFSIKLIAFFKNNKNMLSIIVILIFAAAIAIYPIIDSMVNGNKIESETKENEYTDLTVNKIYVTVAGEVVNPDMYEMTTDDRVDDVIEKAGGFTENSYTDNINLAQKLSDGQYIYVLTKQQGEKLEEENIPDPENDFQGIVNINTASVDELCKLPGIGEKIAERIIEYRDSIDGFESVDELKNVEGIGDSKFNKIKYNLTI